MNQQQKIALAPPPRRIADQVSSNGECLRVVALKTVKGKTTMYTAPISSIAYVRSTAGQGPWVLSAMWDKPAGALGSGLRAVLLPDGRVQDAGCLRVEWPSLTAWEADHNLPGVCA